MGSINIAVSPLQRHAFTRGIVCIFEYAKGLTARGHRLNCVTLATSGREMAQRFSWQRSVDRVESLLFAGAGA